MRNEHLTHREWGEGERGGRAGEGEGREGGGERGEGEGREGGREKERAEGRG